MSLDGCTARVSYARHRMTGMDADKELALVGPTIEFLDDDKISERRRTLLERAHMTEDELRTRAALFQLTPEEASILNEIEDLDFLASA